MQRSMATVQERDGGPTCEARRKRTRLRTGKRAQFDMKAHKARQINQRGMKLAWECYISVDGGLRKCW